ncbi:MAG: PqqD family protein [Eubacteriales bacterium]|nr:PqqD family protein [Eubacteriales bacterium]
MKIKSGFLLRNLGDEHMVVAIGEAGLHFNGLIRLNDTGAWLWNQLKEDVSEEALVEKMCGNFENLDRKTAQTDLKEFLQTIDAAIEK